MDVVRITQALRQQQQHPGRLNSTRGGSTLLSTSTDTQENTSPLHINTTATMNNGVTTTPCASPSSTGNHGNGSGAGGPILSPSSSFFSSLAHFLPGSAAVAVASAAVTGGPSNMNVGEIESLLLRSMPMFGNLVSRD